MKRTTVWLTDEQREQLAQAAKQNGLRAAHLIRLAITQYLRRASAAT